MDISAAAGLGSVLQSLQATQMLSLQALKSNAAEEQAVMQMASASQAAPPPGVGLLMDITA